MTDYRQLTSEEKDETHFSLAETEYMKKIERIVSFCFKSLRNPLN